VELALVLFLFWAVPIALANRIALGKGRRHGWLWGFVLGWIGVLIVALLGNRDEELEALEREVRLAELQRRAAELREERQ